MAVTLQKAKKSDCRKIHEMQVKAFGPLLEKYQDFDTNPAAETAERIVQRFGQEFTDYYLIRLDNVDIGGVRICDFGEVCRLSPIFILPEFQGCGYAQQAMLLLEARYPQARQWKLDTILQEEKLCCLYEKMGYRKTGEYHKIKDSMDLVYYAKHIELKDIPAYGNWRVIRKIDKGWSSDQKYYIEDQNGKKLLLRIADAEGYESKRKEFAFIRKCSTLSFAMSQAIDLGLCARNRKVYMLLSWVQGEDLEDVLPGLPEIRQYRLGVQAGKILRSIHSLPVSPADIAAARDKKEDVRVKLARYEKCGHRVQQDQNAIEFVRKRMEKIGTLPPVYIHNDFHVGNLILTPSGDVGLIDFNRCKCADPYEEFYKIQSFDLEVSVPFSVGQIHGYFEGEPTADFWEINAVYVAFTSLNSIVWAEKFGEDEIRGMQRRCLAAFDDYDGFRTVIPKWYLENRHKYLNGKV